ncbi:MAG: class I SAM-dependent methyltransferase [Rudaea sp.]
MRANGRPHRDVTPGALPLPDEASRGHSERVVAHIRAAIDAAGGFVPFSRYMELALYAPGLGYYVSGRRKFGPGGDFVTAPELSPLYGAALARQLAPILRATRGEIVELGAGSGALAASLLRALAGTEGAPTAYRILEVSPALREEQRATIETCAADGRDGVEWIDRLPDAVDGVVLMNEVLDAVPPAVIARRGDAWFERGVAWRDEALAWDERTLTDAKLLAIARERFPPEGDYVSEVNPAAEALVATLGRRLASGALLIADYGFPAREYYHPQRNAGTLVGHYRHRVHADPFLWPGLSDLTAHVDFTAVAQAGIRAGLQVKAFATQASFLLGCGILDLLRDVGPPESLDYLRAASDVQKLLATSEMGELFKVLLLARGDARWRSLALMDMARRL